MGRKLLWEMYRPISILDVHGRPLETEASRFFAAVLL
jgi:hypothetical protein